MIQTESWFRSQGWSPLDFQQEVWAAYAAGESGLVHASTGTGKTLAAWMGLVEENPPGPGLIALWITPLRALANDTCRALNDPLVALDIPWRVEQRTGDTAASVKQRQLKQMPGGLVTTPETLSLLLSSQDAHARLSHLKLVVVDEWHELMGTKRGTQTELALARLRAWNPGLRVWGLSATLGNMTEAAQALGVTRIVTGAQTKIISVDTLLPHGMERFPWAGHLGAQMMPRVAEELRSCRTALVFTNTRSQSELWYQALVDLLPDMRDQIALHHGSIDRQSRERAENGLKDGSLRAVVCTSSLDLGVDFSPVDRVFQIGSPKGVARLIQRAGRSGHQPGKPSSITIAPTNGMELMEIAALRTALHQHRLEPRIPPQMPLDVLIQHMVTVALGGGFEPDQLRSEISTTHSFRNITDSEWAWCLNFVTQGGECLKAYPDYHKVSVVNGLHVVQDRRIAMQHRMSIGTIVADTSVRVAYLKGGNLGTVEESFASRLRKGDRFVFAGKALEFISLKDLTCYVRRITSKSGRIVRWMGSRMSLSIELSNGLRAQLNNAAAGILEGPEMKAAADILTLQQKLSAVPELDELLIEKIQTREGHHLFIYPLDGRMVHEGLAALISFRLGLREPLTFTFSANDYGFELLSADPFTVTESDLRSIFSPVNLAGDLMGSLNAAELSRRQFREVARVAGLVFQGYPGAPKSTKQVQVSSGLLFDVFARYEPGNLLLGQATREVFERQFERSRLALCLSRMQSARFCFTNPVQPTPFSFPLMVSRLRETLSSEDVEDRVRKLIASLEANRR